MSSAPQSDAESLPCPRCNSRDTKFCYYNNYSTAQPRHFCKNCKRYWTAGGSLRNVPVGGGLRKSKKSKLSKHGKDLLSASAEEYFRSGKPAKSLVPLASPTSSADGVVDEAFSNSVVPLLAYRPTLDFVTESLPPAEWTPLAATSHLDYLSLTTQNYEADEKPVLRANSTFQHLQDVHNGLHHHQDPYESVDQASRSYGEISSEPSQAGHEATVLSNMHSRYFTLQQHLEHDRREIKVQTMLRQSLDESKISSQQGDPHGSLGDHAFLQEGIRRSTPAKEEEDEGLGNVINVRYPYDWEQVSEVLFGGTPDFFQMPTF